MQVRKSVTQVLLAVFAALVLLPVVGVAAQPGGQPRGGPQGGRRRFSPEEMRRRMEEFRQRMNERLREQLGMSEQEFKAVLPLIEKVRTAQRNLRGGRGFFGFGGFRRRGPGGPRRPEPQTEVGKAMAKLRDLLQSESPKTAQIKSALRELRAARKKAQEELKKAQETLRKVLTLKQEAILVLNGTLQ